MTRLLDDSIQKIRARHSTREIKYPEYNEAFEYVDDRFPKAQAKEAVVLECDRSFLDKIGYKGVGGFFSRPHKIVVIPDVFYASKRKRKKTIWETVSGEFEIDEVLVHELLHYVSNKTCETWKSLQVEEEFAYGNSADYLRSRGRADDDIIRKNFMPYLMSIVRQKRHILDDPTRSQTEDQLLFNKAIKEAYQLGVDILAIWDAKCKGTKINPAKTIPFKDSAINLDLD